MDNKGQGAFEYILLLAGVLLIVVLVIIIMRGNILGSANNQIGGSLNTWNNASTTSSITATPYSASG